MSASTPIPQNGLPPIVDPELRDVLNLHRQDIFSAFNCHQLGTIVSFDDGSQTASIKLNLQRLVFNKEVPVNQLSNQPTPITPNIIDYPVLVQVPVCVYSGGGGYISMPIAAGDTCLVLFNDRNIDSWFATGAIVPPASSRMHDLSDGLAIVGFRSLANVIASYDGTNVRIHSATKIKLDNAVTSLKTVQDNLMTVLVNWANGTYGSVPALVSALNTVKDEFDSLLA